MILHFLIWVVYSAIEGIREAFYYHIHVKFPQKQNLHSIFFIQRACVFLLIISFKTFSIKLLIFYAACIFIFPFIHEGVYYTTRNFLEPAIYKKGFFADTEHSTAKINFPAYLRSVFFVAGILSVTVSTFLLIRKNK